MWWWSQRERERNVKNKIFVKGTRWEAKDVKKNKFWFPQTWIILKQIKTSKMINTKCKHKTRNSHIKSQDIIEYKPFSECKTKLILECQTSKVMVMCFYWRFVMLIKLWLNIHNLLSCCQFFFGGQWSSKCAKLLKW